jgi:GNAT superfamily N-acetyltransferase
MYAPSLGDVQPGIELSDDVARIDVDAVHRFLSEESYWAKGRDRDSVARLIAEATRVVGAYDGGRQIGFARVVSDRVTIAWVADVYVLGAYRGTGLGEALMRALIDESGFSDIRWMLGTLDAHTFYERLGFGPPSDRIMERPRATR